MCTSIWSDYFARYTNTQPLYCTPETNRILYVSLHWKINFQKDPEECWEREAEGSSSSGNLAVASSPPKPSYLPKNSSGCHHLNACIPEAPISPLGLTRGTIATKRQKKWHIGQCSDRMNNMFMCYCEQFSYSWAPPCFPCLITVGIVSLLISDSQKKKNQNSYNLGFKHICCIWMIWNLTIKLFYLLRISE